MYGGTDAIIVAHARMRNVGVVTPLPFCVSVSSFKRNHWKRHGH